MVHLLAALAPADVRTVRRWLRDPNCVRPSIASRIARARRALDAPEADTEAQDRNAP